MKNKKSFLRPVIFLILTALLLLTAACKGNSDGENNSNNTSENEKNDTGKTETSNETTYIWGSYNGLTGTMTKETDTANKTETWLMTNEFSGHLYRRIVHTYSDEAMKELDSTDIYDNAGHLLYHLTKGIPYDGAKESDIYGQNILINFKTTSSLSEDKNGSVTGTWTSDSQNSFWVTRLENGLPAVTEHFFQDGLHLTGSSSGDFTWKYTDGKLSSVQIGYDSFVPQYSEYNHVLTLTYEKEQIKDNGKTALQRKTYTITKDDSGHILSADYHYYNDDTNTTREYHNTITVTFQNGKPSRSELVMEESGIDYTSYVLFNENGDVSSENSLIPSVGRGDIGAVLYVYDKDGTVSSIELFNDFNTEDPKRILQVIRTTENGEFLFEEYDDGLLSEASIRFSPLSSKEKQRWSYSEKEDGTVYCQRMTEFYQNGKVKVREDYNEDGSVLSRTENNG